MKHQVLNPEHSVILEGEYDPLVVDLHRLTLDGRVRKASRKLNLNIGNTAREKSDYPYIGSIEWEKAITLNLELNYLTLTQLQFFNFRDLLLTGINGDKKIYNEKGSKIQTGVLKAAYDEIFGIRDPWRGEYLDAHYPLVNGVLRQNHSHVLINGNLVPQHSDLITDYLQENCYIDPTHYNKQGLPTKESRKGEFFYTHPSENSVTRFSADSGRAFLYCDWDPQYSNSSLGVRAAKLYTRKNI